MGSPPQVRGKPAASNQTALCPGITPAGAGKTQHQNQRRQNHGDHPRRCGENFFISPPYHNYLGSPPQVRGKPREFCHHRGCAGITPAGAGKTRSCNARYFSNIGSPPQVRGKREFAKLGLEYRGITPAGAGKTLKRSFRNQPFCSGAVQISFNFSNSLNVSLQSGSAR